MFDRQIPDSEQITSCIRCGSCCRSSSPDLYQADSHLVERGNIPLKYLFTMREGEPVKEPKTRQIKYLASDIVKIRLQDNLPSCFFYESESQGCGIYQTRPSICRAYKCWETRQFDAVRKTPYLTREDLVGEIKGLWDLVSEHQGRCDYLKLRQLAAIVDETSDDGAAREISDMLIYDRSIRESAVKKGMDVAIIDFLFGRSFELALPFFKLRIVKHDGHQVLTTF